MHNPWLDVPLEDYEAHMSAPQVGQLRALAELFEAALGRCRPASVAVLGVAGGNGLERLEPAVTTRIVGVDINPAYLAAVRQRFQAKLPLALHCLDLSVEAVPEPPVKMVHAALIFEHAGTGGCLDAALALVAPGGYFSTVLQICLGNAGPGVGLTPYPSVQKLGEHFRLVEPAELRARIEPRGFKLQHEDRRALPDGKGFWLGIFRRV